MTDAEPGSADGADIHGVQLTVDEVLTTTRAVRKRLDLDRPVPLGIVLECLGLAIHAPTGGNAQDWHFVVVTDTEGRQALARSYRVGAEAALARRLRSSVEAERRVFASAWHLMERFASVPVHVVACKRGRPPTDPAGAAGFYASIYPAVWSLLLALRSRGLGSTLTTAHLRDEPAAAEALGIPYDEVTQVALLPVAYTIGSRFRPAARRPVTEVVSVDRWGSPAPAA